MSKREKIVLRILLVVLIIGGGAGLIKTIGGPAFIFLVIFIWGNNIEQKIS